MTPPPSVFSRQELLELRRALGEGGGLLCPGCREPLLQRPIPPRPDVPYVRRRIWLLCPRCGRSALLDRTEGRPARPPATPPPPSSHPSLPHMARSPAPPETIPPRVGWREWVGLPSLGVPRIKAKVDTGARSSSLHAEDLEEFQQGGHPWIRFTLLPRQRSRKGAVRVEAPVADRRAVRSSSGEARVRPVVEVEVEVGGSRFACEVTLARRDRMGFRMLLGRTALRGRFLVDPGRSFLQANTPDASTPDASTLDPSNPDGESE